MATRRRHAAQDVHAVADLAPGFDGAAFGHRVADDDVEVAFGRADLLLDGDVRYERAALFTHVEGRAGVHARAQRPVCVGHLDLDLEGARRGVEGRIDERDLPGERPVGEDVHAQVDGHADPHGRVVLFGDVDHDLQRVDLHDVQDRLSGEQVPGLGVARRDHARQRRAVLDVAPEVGDHLALHVELGPRLLDLLRRDAARLVDGQQAVVVVLDRAQLHELLRVLRRVERHEQVALAHGVAHVDQDAVDVHARGCRRDVVLAEGLDLRGEDLRQVYGVRLGRRAAGQYPHVGLRIGRGAVPAAGRKGGGGSNDRNQDSVHSVYVRLRVCGYSSRPMRRSYSALAER